MTISTIEATYPLVMPDACPDITPQEYEKARHIAATLRRIENAIHSAASAKDSPGLAKGSETWVSPSGHAAYGAIYPKDAIFNPDYEMINRLRFHCHLFTGYHLSNMLSDSPQWSWTDAIAGHIPHPYMVNAPDWSVGAFLEMTRRLPPHLICQPPQQLGETGWLVEDGIVNRDVMAYQERIALLDAFGLLEELEKRPDLRILEIGGGYGGLAYFVKQQLPHAQYYICDLPLSLCFSATYLTLVCDDRDHLIYDGEAKSTLFTPRDGFTFVPNHLFKDLMTQPFDLVINTMSFAEMSAATVEAYARGAAHILGEWGFLFEQNFDNSHYQRETFCDAKKAISPYFRYKWEASAQTRWGHPNLWINHANPFGGNVAKPERLSPLLAPDAEAEAVPNGPEASEEQVGVQETLTTLIAEAEQLQKMAGNLIQKAQHLQSQLGRPQPAQSEIPSRNGVGENGTARNAPATRPRRKTALYISDRAESGRDCQSALSDYRVTVLALSHRNATTGARREIDPAQPDPTILQELREQNFDVVAMPYGNRLHFRGFGIVPLAQQIAPHMLVIFADGSTRLYEGNNAHRLQYNSSYLDLMFRMIPDIPGRKVFEMGCSDGMVCDLILNARPSKIVGIDMLQNVGCNFPHPLIEYIRMDGTALTFENDSFDLSYSIATMEHVADPFKAIQEIKRVTKPGGYAYVQAGPLYYSPFGHHMFGYFDEYPWIHVRKSEDEIVALGREIGADKTIQQSRGIDIASYVHGNLSRQHINGLRYAEYRLEEFMASPDIEVIHFSRSYEGRNLLTDALLAELSGYTADDLTAHGFDLVFRIRE